MLQSKWNLWGDNFPGSVYLTPRNITTKSSKYLAELKRTPSFKNVNLSLDNKKLRRIYFGSLQTLVYSISFFRICLKLKNISYNNYLENQQSIGWARMSLN